MRKKKVAKKTIKKKPLNKRPPKATVPNQKMITTPKGLVPAPVRAERPKKPNLNKYVQVKDTESRATFVDIGERVQRKELKWSYFGVENSVGIHYYLILNVAK
jgi:hypothetical protein